MIYIAASGWVEDGEPTDLLAGLANGQIILIENNADLVHQTDLLLIVAFERGIGGGAIDLGEEAQDVGGRDRLGCCDGGGGRHCRWMVLGACIKE